MKPWQDAVLFFSVGVGVTVLGYQVVSEGKKEPVVCEAPPPKPIVCDCTGSEPPKVLPSEQFFAPGEIE